MNFEALTTNGLAVASIGATSYLLACNPNDNSVSVVDTAANTIIARVPVGLTPIAVAWDPATSRFFTANRIGDSVTAIELTAPSGILQVRLVATEQVVDEPMDVAIGPGGHVYVIHGSKSTVTRLDPNTLAAVDAFFLGNAFTGIDLVANGFLSSIAAAHSALREPRRLVVDGNLVHVIPLKGDTGFDVEFPTSPGFDYDLLSWDTAASPGTAKHRGGLGSTHEAAVLGNDGMLYVVGGLARNDISGNSNLAGAPFGFVESKLWVLPSALAATSPVAVRDLNNVGGAPVASMQAATPAGIALLQTPRRVRKVFVSSFGTDRIIELVTNAGAPSTWARTAVDLPSPGAGLLNGPRDMEIVSTPAGPRLYVLNELDASVLVYDPNSMTTAPTRIAMANRLTLPEQRGRRYLYDAKISGTGMVSCASCHVDGRTDSLSWRLGNATAPIGAAGADIPFVVDPLTGVVLDPLLDGVTTQLLPGSQPGAHAFPENKGRMVTQSLQGLVSHPVRQGRELFSVGALHWRGDRRDFEAFNEAFVNLMGAAPIPGSGTGLAAQGILATDMRLFRTYVETILYMPNPEQPRDRIFSGDMGSDFTGMDGNGAQRGLENFLARRNSLPDWFLGLPPATGSPATTLSQVGIDFAGRSCVQCHSLLTGTNGRICITDVFGGAGAQPLKSAQLRGLHQREGLLEFRADLPLAPPWGSFAWPAPRVGQSGLTHAGDTVVQGAPPATINRFTSFFFNAFYDVAAPNPQIAIDEALRLRDLVQFLREFDAGSAPVIGLVTTFGNGGGDPAKVALMEAQARVANCDVVVHATSGVTMSGYYYDVAASPGATPLYRNEATGALVTAASLMAGAAIFQAVPVGSGRRIASVSGNGSWAALNPPAPSGIVLLPMRPAPHWRQVANVTKNWNPPPPGMAPGPDDFLWMPLGGQPEPVSPLAQRTLQAALEGSSHPTGFGVRPAVPGVHHHEPPRRFRVTGTDIQLGARLLLWVSSDPANPAPFASSYLLLDIDLFPTRDAGGALVWETAAEVDPLVTLELLCGGPFAPGVARTVLKGTPAPQSILPDTWNRFIVSVVNASGLGSPLSLQSLEVVDH